MEHSGKMTQHSYRQLLEVYYLTKKNKCPFKTSTSVHFSLFQKTLKSQTGNKLSNYKSFYSFSLSASLEIFLRIKSS